MDNGIGLQKSRIEFYTCKLFLKFRWQIIFLVVKRSFRVSDVRAVNCEFTEQNAISSAWDIFPPFLFFCLKHPFHIGNAGSAVWILWGCQFVKRLLNEACICASKLKHFNIWKWEFWLLVCWIAIFTFSFGCRHPLVPRAGIFYHQPLTSKTKPLASWSLFDHR